MDKSIRRLAERARRNRLEIRKARLSRREMLRLGLLTASGALVAAQGLSSRALAKSSRRRDDDEREEPSSGYSLTVPSPPHRPWVTPFRIMPVAQPVAFDSLGLSDNPAEWRTLIDGGLSWVPHQRIAEFPPQLFYHHEVREHQHRFHEDWASSTMWGFGPIGGETTSPGPVFHARYGEPILVRLTNRLPPFHFGFGVPEPTIHLHNAHTPSESDGYPLDYFRPGQSKDHFYPNIYAGGDEREGLSTLWYHDHHLDHTAENVYAGLVGQYLLFDHLDTGDEATGLRLPSGEFDVPMIVNDAVFDEDFQPVFDLFNLDGILGDKQMVNNVIQPFWDVKMRRYRLRIQNAAVSRWFDIAFWDGKNYLPFWQISSDGNLLPQPVKTTRVRIANAARVDLVIDFDKIAASTRRLYMVNRAAQFDGRGPEKEKDSLKPGTGLVQINIVGDTATDESADPAAAPMLLRPLPDPDFAALLAHAATVPQRVFEFGRRQGAWVVNDKFFNPRVVTAAVAQGSSEVWVLRSDGGWHHPIHHHFEEHRTLSRNGKAPPVVDMGRKDVADLNPSEEVRIFSRWRDFKGRYVMHCHNLVHEDHAMMIRFDVV
jgi:FtsP/CotA-like multicopper oxidase with cupredoxin domain